MSMLIITSLVVLLCLAALTRSRAQPDLILLGGLAVLLAIGVVTPERALAGFANPGVLTLGALYIVVGGLRETGAIAGLATAVLGFRSGEKTARLRMMGLMAGSSAFINNTPLVAVAVPLVRDWAQRIGLAPSRLLMPLSFAAIAGGTCTLLGSSVNLAVAGLLETATDGAVQLSLWEPALLGLPVAVAVLIYCATVAPFLLPTQGSKTAEVASTGRYFVEFMVEPDGPMAGKTVLDAGLRHLRGVYLAEILRHEDVLSAVGPDEVLQADDRLVFVGDASEVSDLFSMRGLRLCDEQVFKLDAPRHRRDLAEAVVSSRGSIVGRTVRAASIRTRHNVVVLSVFREGTELRGQKIGDIELSEGDVLLLEGPAQAVEAVAQSNDFLMVQKLGGNNTPHHERRGWAAGIFGGLVVIVSAGWLDMLTAAWLAAAAMLLSGCLKAEAARKSIDWEILMVLAAAIGLGNALVDAGVIDLCTRQLEVLIHANGWLIYSALFLTTVLLSAFVTNAAAVVMLFPLAHSLALSTGLDVSMTALVLLVAASSSYLTPISYQTNLMVYNAGGYRFVDFFRVGWPLTLIAGAITVTLAMTLPV